MEWASALQESQRVLDDRMAALLAKLLDLALHGAEEAPAAGWAWAAS